MAIFHCNVKVHSRLHDSSNHAVRSAAYRAGTILVDATSGHKYNYSRKSEVIYSEILSPENTPANLTDRATLWSTVEKSENRVDAQLFREVEVALPIEGNPDSWKKLLRKYIKKNFVSKGMIADVSIHNNPGNPHAHIMLTLRDIKNDGFGNKNREWNDKKLLESWRKGWEAEVNASLEELQMDTRVSHKSLKDQGIDRLPMVHEGREGIGGQNRHKVEARRQHNRRIRDTNRTRSEIRKSQAESAQIHARIKELDAEIEELSKPEKTESNDITPVATGIPPKNITAIPSTSVAKSPILVSINKKILQSVKPVQPSRSTAMMVYEAPRPKIGTIPGIDRNISFNLPTKPIEAARCYALRSLFGTNIDLEFNARLGAMQNVGLNYSWEAFYLDIQDTVDSKHGPNLTWWRSYTNMVYHKHINKLTDIYEFAPKKYVNKLDEYVGSLLPGYTERKEEPPTNLTTGQSANTDVTSPEPVEPKRPIDIPWTELPEDPEPNEEEGFNPYGSEPETEFNPYRERESSFNPSNEPLRPRQVPSEPTPYGYRGSSTPKPW